MTDTLETRTGNNEPDPTDLMLGNADSADAVSYTHLTLPTKA